MIDKDTRKDIQFLLIMYIGYIDDTSSENPWENEKVIELANKYGFTKENIYKGFEEYTY